MDSARIRNRLRIAFAWAGHRPMPPVRCGIAVNTSLLAHSSTHLGLPERESSPDHPGHAVDQGGRLGQGYPKVGRVRITVERCSMPLHHADN